MIIVAIPGAASGQPLGDAVDWVKAVLLGSIATTIAVVAIAGVGLLMLSGRVPIRRGATVILGCFILFSAGTIANGLLGSLALARGGEALPSPAPPAYEATVPAPAPFDPYEGAAAPVRRQQDVIE